MKIRQSFRVFSTPKCENKGFLLNPKKTLLTVTTNYIFFSSRITNHQTTDKLFN